MNKKNSEKVTKRKQKETVKKVIQYLRNHSLEKAEEYLIKKPTLEEQFEWLVKLKWTFGASPTPTSQNIENLLRFLEEKENANPTNFEIFLKDNFTPNDDYYSIDEAFKLLNELLPYASLEDWTDQENSLMQLPTGKKDSDGNVNVENKELHINEDRLKKFENDLKDSKKQLEVLTEIFIKVDEIIREIPNLKKGPGATKKDSFLFEQTKKVWSKQKKKIMQESQNSDGSRNKNEEIRNLISLIPELKRKVDLYEPGKKDQGISFQTIRSWHRKWNAQ